MSFNGTLKPFQKEALYFLLDAERALLSFDQGLGKTILAIAWAEELLDSEDVSGGLIIVPDSLKYQWESQIKTFTHGATVTVIDGAGAKGRERQLRMAHKAEYVILSYDNLMQDDVWKAVTRYIDTDFLIADEVTYLKNHAAKRTKRIKKLQRDFMLGLTGTPIENRLEESFSIMEWVDPSVFGRFDYFDKSFIIRDHWGGVKGYRNVNQFVKMMSDVSIRKTRHDKDVKPFMPVVNYMTPYVARLDRKAASLYRFIVNQLLEDLSEPGFSSFDLAAQYGRSDYSSEADLARRGRIMSKMMCLRMLSAHPDLLNISAERYTETSTTDWQGMKAGSKYAAELLEAGLLKGVDKWPSPKLELLVDRVVEHIAESKENKVVIFSFFREMLNKIEEALNAKGIGSVQFNGGMNPRQRDEAKKKFQTDSDIKAFISSDAGGYGVDLPQANLLLSYDLPWSAGSIAQRNSRIIRLSTEFDEVSVGSILVRGSIDEYQHKMLQDKQALADAFIDSKGINHKGELNIDSDSLTEFLYHNYP